MRERISTPAFAVIAVAILSAHSAAALSTGATALELPGRGDERLEQVLKGALGRHRNGAPDRDHELAIVADLERSAGAHPDDWLPAFWGSYLLTQVAMAHREDRVAVLARAHGLLDDAFAAAVSGRASVPATLGDLHALRSLIFFFEESVAASAEDRGTYQARRLEQMQQAARLAPNSPAVLIMAATAVIREGEEERDLRKMLVGSRALDAAAGAFAARAAPHWLSSHFNQEWLAPWSAWVDDIIENGFDDDDEQTDESSVAGAAGGSPSERDLLPSEALILVNYYRLRQPDRPQQEFASRYLERTRTDGLDDPLERLALAEIYFLNYMPDPAHEGFEPFLERDDAIGRAAWLRALQIRYRAYDQHDRVEREVAEYRSRYGTTPVDRFHLYQQVSNMAATHGGEGRPERAADLIVEEVESLDVSAPFQSYLLPGRFFEAFAAAGRSDQACGLMDRSRARLQETLDRLVVGLRGLPVAADYPVALGGTALGENPNDVERAAQYQILIWRLQERLQTLCS